MSKMIRHLSFIIVITTIVGCATEERAPIEDRGASPPASPTPQAPVAPGAETPSGPEMYTVKPGETVYRIAFEHGLDYHDLAAWNGIDTTFALHPGQLLRLRPPLAPGAPSATELPNPAGVITAPLRTLPPVVEIKPAPLADALPERPNSETFKSSPKAIKLPYSDRAYAQLAESGSASPAAETPATVVSSVPKTTGGIDNPDKIDWAWPTSGKVIGNFNENANLKGIDIGGTMGQPVTASAAGKIVYADSGLRGYGKLVVIKHNKTYLSAYAHNSKILVKEGQQVARGQKIGEMGNTDADTVELHFEIRQLGKPVDPLKYLPPA